MKKKKMDFGTNDNAFHKMTKLSLEETDDSSEESGDSECTRNSEEEAQNVLETCQCFSSVTYGYYPSPVVSCDLSPKTCHSAIVNAL